MVNLSVIPFWERYVPIFSVKFKPVYYKRYVDDIFVLFRSPHHLERFYEYLNTKHANIKFTKEKEVHGSLPFLDVLISRNNKGFTTTVYHKPTFSGVYSNFNSFIVDEYKHGLIFTLLFRIFSIVSDFSKFHEEVNYLKNVLKKNSFPSTLVDKCIKIFLNKQFSQKILEHPVPKKKLLTVLPYLGMSSLCLRTRLQKSINSNISFCKIKVIFKSSTRLANSFRFKDKILYVYALTLFISLRVGDEMLPITVKLAIILKLELVNTQVSHL